MKFVVVRGVASGASFATRLRRLNEDVEIIIYENQIMFLMQIVVCLIFYQILLKQKKN